MTYRDLLLRLKCLNPEQLDSAVTVCNATTDEYFATGDLYTAEACTHDELDPGHPYIVFVETTKFKPLQD